MIREIDIWRVAVLMVNRYADEAKANSDRRVPELATHGDHAGDPAPPCEAFMGFLAISPPPGYAAGQWPKQAGQIAGDRGCDDIGLLAVAGELSIAPTAAAAPVIRKLALALVGF